MCLEHGLRQLESQKLQLMAEVEPEIRAVRVTPETMGTVVQAGMVVLVTHGLAVVFVTQMLAKQLEVVVVAKGRQTTPPAGFQVILALPVPQALLRLQLL